MDGGRTAGDARRFAQKGAFLGACFYQVNIGQVHDGQNHARETGAAADIYQRAIISRYHVAQLCRICHVAAPDIVQGVFGN